MLSHILTDQCDNHGLPNHKIDTLG